MDHFMKKELDLLRKTAPLVHHITNYVTVNDCANITLAIGASPVMADDEGEAAAMARLASSLVINIGTLNQRTIPSMMAAGKAANEKGIPVILDPVGAGATPLRTDTARKLMETISFAVIRGNLSEILCLAGLGAHTKGVDVSMEDRAMDPEGAAKTLAEKTGAVTAVTGAVDVITDGKRRAFISNGVPLMGRVTGTGCMCSSLIGSFCGADPDHPFEAAAAAVTAMGVLGDIAMEAAGEKGTGSFRAALMDAASKLTGDELERRAKYREA